MENKTLKLVCDCIGIIVGVAIAILFWTGLYYIICLFCQVTFVWRVGLALGIILSAERYVNNLIARVKKGE